jgi:hypothetical protein
VGQSRCVTGRDAPEAQVQSAGSGEWKQVSNALRAGGCPGIGPVAGGKVVEMDILADPDRLSRLDLSAIE